MGVVMKHASIFCTTHVPTIHSIVATKQCTTVDHLTGRRFALDIVCGWYSLELRMFELQTMDHDTRYAYADEWMEVVRKLWTMEEEFDYAGKFFNIEKGFISRNRCSFRTRRSRTPAVPALARALPPSTPTWPSSAFTKTASPTAKQS